MAYENDAYMNAASLDFARKGIVDPQPVVIDRGALIYHFSDNIGEPAKGCWWTEANEYEKIQEFGVLQNLASPLAARVLLGIAHQYNSMTIFLNATTKYPLRAYRGEGLFQHLKYTGTDTGLQGRTNEFLEPRGSVKIQQLFIPGLHESGVAAKWLNVSVPRTISVNDSEIFGTVGVPAGTVRQ